MKYIKILLLIVFSIIYIPLNHFLVKIQGWYLPLYKTDRVLYFLVAPFYWIYASITLIVSIPYEAMTKNIH